MPKISVLLLLSACCLLFSQCDELLSDDNTQTNNTYTPTKNNGGNSGGGGKNSNYTNTNNGGSSSNNGNGSIGGVRRDDFTDKDLNYEGKSVILTKHARCRMDCRYIDAFEIQEIINNGNINERKTDRNATPCPAIAYEGTTSDKQQVRIIVGNCTPAKIITVIDLKNDFECTCD